MKVLFLDVDGVLNSARWMMSRGKMADYPNAPDLADRKAWCRWHAELQLDPACIARLNAVVDRTGCSVVLSSTWRIGEHGLVETQFSLRHRGFRHTLIDRTPSCAQKTAGGIFIGMERAAEIAEWLGEHPEVTCYAIVDDHGDMGPLRDRLVRTSWERGLEDEHVERLVSMLGLKHDPERGRTVAASGT